MGVPTVNKNFVLAWDLFIFIGIIKPFLASAHRTCTINFMKCEVNGDLLLETFEWETTFCINAVSFYFSPTCWCFFIMLSYFYYTVLRAFRRLCTYTRRNREKWINVMNVMNTKYATQLLYSKIISHQKLTSKMSYCVCVSAESVERATIYLVMKWINESLYYADNCIW